MPASQSVVKINSIEKIGSQHFKMALVAPTIARRAKPGQFIHVRCNGGMNPLLRRPLSIHRVGKNYLEIFYKVVGKGTKILSERKSGEVLDIVGPLGNGFDLCPTRKKHEAVALVAGGMGIAPLFFLAEKIAKNKRPKSKIKNIAILGAKTKKEIFFVSQLRSLGFKVLVSTEDGSLGKKGLATDLLEKNLQTAIYACGPSPMLKKIAQISGSKRIPCQISLENWMGCGLGACLGCVIKIKSFKKRKSSSRNFVYKRVCKDGPVFNAEAILWQ